LAGISPPENDPADARAGEPDAASHREEAATPLDGARDDVSPPDAEPGPSDGACDAGTSDPKNCGRCGVDCSANAAVVQCVSSTCVRNCADGFADCNHDLDRGSQGDGCETDVRNDIAHCGACRPCPAVSGGVAACVASICRTYEIATAPAGVGPLYGNPAGGAPFTMVCGPGEAVIGMRGIGSDSIWGFGVDCGRLELSQGASGYRVDVVATSQLPQVGGNIDPPPPPFSLKCPPGTVVASLTGTTWAPPPYSENLKQIAVACAPITVDASRKLVVQAPVSVLSAGVVGSTVTAFSRSCSASGAVDGFVGRSGAFVDAISVSCTTISVRLR